MNHQKLKRQFIGGMICWKQISYWMSIYQLEFLFFRKRSFQTMMKDPLWWWEWIPNWPLLEHMSRSLQFFPHLKMTRYKEIKSSVQILIFHLTCQRGLQPLSEMIEKNRLSADMPGEWEFKIVDQVCLGVWMNVLVCSVPHGYASVKIIKSFWTQRLGFICRIGTALAIRNKCLWLW